MRSGLFNLGVYIVDTATVLRLANAGVSSTRIGLVETVSAVGGLLGSMVAVKTVGHVRTGVFAVVASTILAVVLAATAATTSPWAVGALFAVGMFLMPANNAGVVGYFSHIVPNSMQGRFYGAAGLITGVLAPLGPALAGVLTEHLGGSPTVLIGSAITLLSGIVILAVTELRTLPRPTVWSTWDTIDTDH